MNTNKTFNFNRFYNLFCNDILINYKRYILWLAGFIIALYAFMVYDMESGHYIMIDERMVHGYSNNNYLSVFMFGFVAIGVFIGTSFSELSDKIRARNYMQLPGSIFEKLLVQFIIRFVISILLFIVIFWVEAHIARLTVMRSEYVHRTGMTIDRFHYASMLSTLGLNTLDRIIVLIGIFSIGTAIFSARLFFKKLALVKIIILGATLIYLFYLCMVIFSHIFSPEITHGFSIQLKTYEICKGFGNIELYASCICIVSWVFLLPLAYFKLKEKQE